MHPQKGAMLTRPADYEHLKELLQIDENMDFLKEAIAKGLAEEKGHELLRSMRDLAKARGAKGSTKLKQATKRVAKKSPPAKKRVKKQQDKARA